MQNRSTPKKPATQTAVPEIVWPADWAADEGWPSPAEAPKVMGETRTYAELDAALRRQGSSLDEVAEQLGRPTRMRRG